MGSIGESFKRFANLLIKKNGTVWINRELEYPYEKRWNRHGECDGYKYVRLNGGPRASVHSLMGRTWIENPDPTLFDRLDHISRDRWDCSAKNLRFSTAHLNAINRCNVNNTKFDYDLRRWFSSFWVKGQEIIVGWFSTFLEAHTANMKKRAQVYNDLERLIFLPL